jgi:hypothetical protein
MSGQKKSAAVPAERWTSFDTAFGWLLVVYFFVLWAFRLNTRGEVGA